MNWLQAKCILRNGGKITRPNWEAEHFWVMSKDGFERILCHDGTNALVHIKQLEENDWGIWKKELSLSDRECNVLINKIDLNEFQTIGDLEIRGKENLYFEKGFLKDSVKGAIKKLKKYMHLSSYNKEVINRVFGDKLC